MGSRVATVVRRRLPVAAACVLLTFGARQAAELQQQNPAAAAPQGAQCLGATDIGPLPAMYVEPGITIGPGNSAWRMFALGTNRALRIETLGAAPTAIAVLSTGCRQGSSCAEIRPDNSLAAGVGSFETGCLHARGEHRYLLGVEDSSAASTFTLQITDLGPCFLPTDVIVRSFAVDDLDGDRDGFADTGETVELTFVLSNKTDTALTNVVATLTTSDPKVDCISVSQFELPALAAHADAAAPSPMRLRVRDTTDRAAAGKTAADIFRAGFTLAIHADGFGGTHHPVEVELDLDAAHSAVATSSYQESFENGLGSFALMNLDVGKASNSASNGYRCSYVDPDIVNCASYNAGDCFLGFPAGQFPANDWHIHAINAPDGGRAFAGSRSVHYGYHLDPGDPDFDTYRLSQLDALASSAVNLAARVCRDDTAADPRACAVDGDCAPLDAAAWRAQGAAAGIALSGAAPTTLSWSAPADPGGTQIRYDVLRSSSPGVFAQAVCLLSDSTATTAQDHDPPPTGGGSFFYLVRAENACGGTLGADSSGAARSGVACP